MEFTDEQINFIRADLENDFKYSKLIHTTRKIIEESGRDFDKEFKKWKEEKK